MMGRRPMNLAIPTGLPALSSIMSNAGSITTADLSSLTTYFVLNVVPTTCSGGTPYTFSVHGRMNSTVPPEQVIGTTFKTKYAMKDGKPAIVIEPQLDLLDDKAGKPVAIAKYIGRRPLMAFGNSDGDFEMLEYTTAGKGPRFGLLVHHTDAEREYAYDRKSHFGKLDKGLDEAAKRGWVVASMKDDWKAVFPAKK